MIIVDIETSGLEAEKHGIWQIGAVDFANPQNTFVGECRIDEEDIADPQAETVHGKSEAYLRDTTRQSQKTLLETFFAWCENAHMKNFVCQNPQFDLGYINTKARKYGLTNPFHFRAFDLHSIAALRYNDVHNTFFMRNGSSGLNLLHILEFCGMPNQTVEHDALSDAKQTAECLSRIVNGTHLFEEYKAFDVPVYLKR